jgi:hypothetical protein
VSYGSTDCVAHCSIALRNRTPHLTHPFLSQLYSLTVSLQPFECWNSSVAEVFFSLKPHCRIIVFPSDEKDVHLMGQHCLSFPSEVNE